jgi:hypothetical protein
MGDPYRDAWSIHSKRYPVPLVAKDREIGSRFASALALCRKVGDELFQHENVVGVGASLKLRSHVVTEEPCIVVFVRTKLPLKKLRSPVPEKFYGIPTDLVECGEPRLCALATRIRPTRAGYSIGHAMGDAGTFGCLAKDQATGEILMLSNNHVIARINSARPGDPIICPGRLHGGRDPEDRIARLERFHPFDPVENVVDAAVARPIDPASHVSNVIEHIGVPTGSRRIEFPGLPVQKVGATTAHTTGVTTTIGARIDFQLPGIGLTKFIETIVTTGMSEHGDSGSVLLDEEKYVVGLLFGEMTALSGEQFTCHNDIEMVKSSLAIEI